MRDSNETALDCPLYTEKSDEWIDFFNFWVGGVTQTCIAVPGLLGNFEKMAKLLSYFIHRKSWFHCRQHVLQLHSDPEGAEELFQFAFGGPRVFR